MNAEIFVFCPLYFYHADDLLTACATELETGNNGSGGLSSDLSTGDRLFVFTFFYVLRSFIEISFIHSVRQSVS